MQQEMDGTHVSTKLPETRCSCKSRLLSRLATETDKETVFIVDEAGRSLAPPHPASHACNLCPCSAEPTPALARVTNRKGGPQAASSCYALTGYGFEGALVDPVFALPVRGSERALSSSVVAASTQSFSVSRGPHRTWIFASPTFMWNDEPPLDASSP